MSGEVGQETCHEGRASNTGRWHAANHWRTRFVPNTQRAAFPSLQRWDLVLAAERLSFLYGYGLLRLGEIFQSTAGSSPVVENDGSLLGCIEESYRAQRALRRNSTVTITAIAQRFYLQRR
jgi:hypothetical protein